MPHHFTPPKSVQETKNSNVAKGAGVQNTQALLPVTVSVLQRAQREGRALTPPDVLYLQRAIGNQAVAQLLERQRSESPQSRLRVGPVGDRYEREADQISSQVSEQISGKQAPLQRSTKAKGVQRESNGNAPMGPEGGAVDANLAQRIESSHSGGMGMSSPMRAKLEPQLGADLSGVQLHTGSDAVQLNRELGSKAFTHRNHIYYGAGQSPDDMALTTHEAVHTIQQGAVKQGALKGPSKAIQRKGIQRMMGRRKPIMRAPAQGMIQREFFVGAAQQKKTAKAWKQIKAAGYAPQGGWTKQHRKRLDLWVNRSSTYSSAKWYMTGQSQTFHSWKEAAYALDAHARAQANRKREKAAAKTESKNPIIRKNLGTAMSTIAKWIGTSYPKSIVAPPGYRKPPRGFNTVWSYLEQFKGQYRHWYPNGKVQTRMKTPQTSEVSTNFAILREILYALGGVQLANIDPTDVQEFLDMLNIYIETGGRIKQGEEISKQDHKKYQKAQTSVTKNRAPDIEPHTAKYQEARLWRGLNESGETVATRIDKDAQFDDNGYKFQETRRDDLTPETYHPWVQFAQSRNLPLRAGASNTTDRMLYMAGLAGVGVKGKQAISWAGFIFWNTKYKKIQGSGHTFHEVMDVANVNHAVPYDLDGTNPYQFKEATEPVDSREESSESEPEEDSTPEKIMVSSSEDSSDSSSEEEEPKPKTTVPSSGVSKPVTDNKGGNGSSKEPTIVSKLSGKQIEELKKDMWKREFEKYFSPEEIRSILLNDSEIRLLASLLSDSDAFIRQDLQKALSNKSSGSPTKPSGGKMFLDEESSSESTEEEPRGKGIRIVKHSPPSGGVDLSLFTERGHYKTVAEFKVKNSRGLTVTVPPGCDMMITAIHGQDDIDIEVILGKGGTLGIAMYAPLPLPIFLVQR